MPYCIFLFNDMLDTDLNPVWDEIIYIPGMSFIALYTRL